MPEVLLSFLRELNPGFILIAAGLAAVLARGAAMRALVMLGAPALALVAMLYGPPRAEDWAQLPVMGFDLVFYRVDSLSFVFGLAFLIATALGGLYSLHREKPLEDAAGLVYAGGAVGATLAGDLLTLFIFWETTALASALLIFLGGRSGAGAAGLRYLVIQLASGLLLLAGAALLHAEGAPTVFSRMDATAPQPLTGLLDMGTTGGLLIFLSLGLKAAFPLVHAWLQDAYPRSSETGAVVLSAFTTKLAVYAILRCFAGEPALIWIGAVMTVFPVFFAVIENDLRKVLSYSLNNQVGFMVCAAGVGTSLAINGATAHAFAHIIYKSLLFMTMGAVLLRTGTTRASELGGLHRSMPLTALFCIIGAASISGVPLFSGFIAKSMTMSAVEGEHLVWVWLMLLFASAGVLEHSGIKIPYCAFFGHDSGRRPAEAPFNMLLAMGTAAFICIALGLNPGWLYSMLPHPGDADAYLRDHLWDPLHVLAQAELLAFAALAFVLLKRAQLYAPEVPGVILDVDWFWRRGGPGLARWMGRGLGAAGARWTLLWRRGGDQLAEAGRQALAYGKALSVRSPLESAAIWTVVFLGIVLVSSLFT